MFDSYHLAHSFYRVTAFLLPRYRGFCLPHLFYRATADSGYQVPRYRGFWAPITALPRILGTKYRATTDSRVSLPRYRIYRIPRYRGPAVVYRGRPSPISIFIARRRRS